MSLLTIKDLSVVINNKAKTPIVENVNLTVEPGEIVGLVGGSGSGKTTTGYCILGLLDPALSVRSGEIIFEGKNLLQCKEDFLRKVRGGKISMIFQEPLNAFNPVFSIGYQIDEMLRYHTELAASDREKRTLELLDLVGLPDPHRIIKNYPHQLSGGMRQRAMIAQAISTNPALIIADEPTSSLDVTLQARVIELFAKIQKELGLSFLLITHDLGMVGHLSDRTNVMCQGRIVETGKTSQIIDEPQHEYTKRLLGALKLT